MQDRLFRSLPYVALAVAAVLVVVLGQQKRTLLEELQRTRADLRDARTTPMRGMYMPAFQAATLEGQQVTIGELPAEGRQVLLMYTTTCPYCLSSIPAWKQLKAATDTMTSIRATVYGVSLDSADATRKYIAQHQLPYPTVRFPDEKTAGMYRSGIVPITLVLDENGRAIYSRVGELTRKESIDTIMAAIRWRPVPRDTTRPSQPQSAQQQSR